VDFYTVRSEAAMDNLVKRNPTAFRVLNHILFSIKRSDANVGAVTLTNKAIAEKLECSERTVMRATKWLNENGYMRTTNMSKYNTHQVNFGIAATASSEKISAAINGYDDRVFLSLINLEEDGE